MSDSEKRYKVLGFRAENYKRVSLVDMRPDLNVVTIGGKNRAGKSSLFEGLQTAIEGTGRLKRNPIRSGEAKSTLHVDLGSGQETEIRITRTIKGKDDGGYTPTLKVEVVNGPRPPSPQAFLDRLVGKLSMDPLAFTRLKPEDQFDTLRGFVSGVDFDAIAKADKEDRENRTVENRRAKDYAAQADGVYLPAGPLPNPVSKEALDALESELARAADHNASVEREKSRQEQLAADLARAASLIARLEQDLKDARAAKAKTEEAISQAPALADPIDVRAVQQQIRDARVTIGIHGDSARRKELLDAARKHEAEGERLTKAIADREKAKQAAIAKAKLPVPGLGFGDGFITLNGEPFADASRGEAIEASMAIAAALNPSLAVMRIEDASLLDDDAMVRVEAFAKERDFQVWLEVVDTSEAVGFIMEEGHLQGEEPAASAAAVEDDEEGV